MQSGGHKREEYHGNDQHAQCGWAGVGPCAAAMSLSAVAQDAAVPVNALNFARAESDLYFASTVKRGGFGKFDHNRTPAPIDRQDVVRMNRDTLYSGAVFDLDAAPVTITLPDAGKRFVSLMIVNEDHYALDTVYAPTTITYTRKKRALATSSP